jgi:mercuric ion transport protein
MKELAKQISSTSGAAIAAACCAGASWALAALTAAGAGFLINDAVLIPLFAALLALSVWFLYRSARAHNDLAPFYLGIAGAVVAFAGLWTWIAAIVGGLATMVIASVWDFARAKARRRPADHSRYPGRVM